MSKPTFILSSPIVIAKKAFQLAKAHRKEIVILWGVQIAWTIIVNLWRINNQFISVLYVFLTFVLQIIYFNILENKSGNYNIREIVKDSLLQAPGYMVLLSIITILPFIFILTPIFASAIIINLLGRQNILLNIVVLIGIVLLNVYGIKTGVRKALSYLHSGYIYLYEQQGIRKSLAISTRISQGNLGRIFVHLGVASIPNIIYFLILTFWILRSAGNYSELTSFNQVGPLLLFTLIFWGFQILWSLFLQGYSVLIYRELKDNNFQTYQEALQKPQKLLRTKHFLIFIVLVICWFFILT